MAAFFYDSTGSNTAPYDTWAKAATSLVTVAAAMAAGDTLWWGDDTNESLASTPTVIFPGTIASPNFIYCVDHTVASPGTGDLKIGVAGAGSFTTTGNNSINIKGNFYAFGIVISAGNGANAPTLNPCNLGTETQIYDTCKLTLGGTTGGFLWNINGGAFICRNCTFKFASTAASMGTRFKLVLHGGSIDATGSKPATLFNHGGTAIIEGFDFSFLSGSTIFSSFAAIPSAVLLKDCLLPSSITIAAATALGVYGSTLDVIRCDSGGTNYRSERHDTLGDLTTVTAVIRTGGAGNGTTGISWKAITSSRARWSAPFVAPPISVWNAATGSTVAVTIEGIADPRDFSALPLNDDIWFDVEYLGTSGNPRGVFASGTKANNLATGAALTASTQAWDSQATAWQAAHAYSLGDILKSTNNAGRLFVCTTAGTSAGSEPAGYASAVDGGSVTDNTATFKAMWRFKLTVTTGTVQLAGPLTIYPKVARASLNGIYIDPVPAISGLTVSKSYMVAPGVYQVEPSTGSGGGGVRVISG